MTTTESDRPILIMSLLGLDLSPVLDIPPKVEGSPERAAIERMRAVYLALPEFPSRILFMDGERFPEYGMRWAKTYCNNAGMSEKSQKRLGDIPGQVLPRGLCVEFPMLLTTTRNDAWGVGDRPIYLKYGHDSDAIGLTVVNGSQWTTSKLPQGPLDKDTQIGFLFQNKKKSWRSLLKAKEEYWRLLLFRF